MAQLPTSNLDEASISRLKGKAEALGVSLEVYLRDTLVQLAKPSRAEIAAQVDVIRVQTRPWQSWRFHLR